LFLFAGKLVFGREKRSAAGLSFTPKRKRPTFGAPGKKTVYFGQFAVDTLFSMYTMFGFGESTTREYMTECTFWKHLQ
jgi:hypothetical protein